MNQDNLFFNSCHFLMLAKISDLSYGPVIDFASP